MTYDEFVSVVEQQLKEALPESFEISQHTTEKNNGSVHNGIMIREQDNPIAPILYLDGYYDLYSRGETTIQEVVTDMIRTYAENAKPDYNVNQFADFPSICDKIIFRVINAEKNMSRLENVPHTIVNDLAVVYSVYIGDFKDQIASVLITNEHMEMWGVNQHTIAELAVNRTPIIFPPTLNSMFEILGIFGHPIDENAEPPMWILSNDHRLYGAAAMFYPNKLEEVADELGTDEYYILPSSIHEVLILNKDDSRIDPMELRNLVKHVNSTSVAEEDVLSDSVYLYSRGGSHKIQVL